MKKTTCSVGRNSSVYSLPLASDPVTAGRAQWWTWQHRGGARLNRSHQWLHSGCWFHLFGKININRNAGNDLNFLNIPEKHVFVYPENFPGNHPWRSSSKNITRETRFHPCQSRPILGFSQKVTRVLTLSHMPILLHLHGLRSKCLRSWQNACGANKIGNSQALTCKSMSAWIQYWSQKKNWFTRS